MLPPLPVFRQVHGVGGLRCSQRKHLPICDKIPSLIVTIQFYPELIGGNHIELWDQIFHAKITDGGRVRKICRGAL
jgi:hypothetical protein